MKTWIDEVRGALQSAQAEYKFKCDDGVDPSRKYSWEDLAEFMYEQTQQALAAIPDEDPMVALLRWLDAGRQDCIAWGGKNDGTAGIYRHIMRHIESMGYKLEEGE